MNNKAVFQTVPLLELPGKVAGAPVKVRLLEPAQSDPRRLYEQILSGRYARPFIIDDGETRQLLFSLDFIQSSMRIDDPFALDFAYTRKMMAFLLFAPKPDHMLMVGLGGGSLAKFCHRHLPHTRLTVVEINPDVIALRGAFDVPVDERLAIIQADAADYLPLTEGDTDVLLLDGFDTAGIAPSFLNRDFYQAARRRLRPAGMLVANFAGPKRGWAAHLSLLNEIFERRVQVLRIPGGDNHIAFAFVDAGYPPDWRQLEKQAEALARQIPLDFPALLKRLRRGAAKQAAGSQLPGPSTATSKDAGMQKVLKQVKGRGEQLDVEIAAATRIPLADVRLYLSELSKGGDVIVCHSTRFIKGRKSEGMLCRIAGFIPTASPGRKPGVSA
jgi:spermidine synthase